MKKDMPYLCRLLCILLLAAVCLLVSGCQENTEPVSETGFYFDTFVTLTAYGRNAETALKEGFALCDKYEKQLSRTLEGSDIYRLNHAGGNPVTVQEETAYLLQQAIEYAKLTEGRIDPTLAPLSELWNFSGDPRGPVPEDSRIQELLSHVDYKTIRIDGNTVCLTDPKAQVDLGFIAKGYIADRLKELFLDCGVTSGLINLGGNVLAVGQKPDGSAFRVGIQKPFDEYGEKLCVVDLSDQSLVSSGSYERYFEEDRKLYFHILDPSTGYPVETDLDGVTILSGSSMEGDALSTTCFLLGQKKGQELIESLPGIEALFVLKDGSVIATDGFAYN